MKIILSHDIDHLHWKEHYFNDLFLQGLIYRNVKGLFQQNIDLHTLRKRLKCWGRLHKIPELLAFYETHNLKANFFFGMQTGLKLSYNYKKAQEWMQLLIDCGHKVGVHGMCFNDKEKIKQEFERFNENVAVENFGIRTHYLRMNDDTLNLFEGQGYIYDSSIDAITKPFKVNKLWEIPISLMDASLMSNPQMNLNLENWKEKTLRQLSEAQEQNIPYFVINFHDIYFSEAYQVFKDWYIWLIEKLTSENYEFVNFEDAVIELNAL